MYLKTISYWNSRIDNPGTASIMYMITLSFTHYELFRSLNETECIHVSLGETGESWRTFH